MVKEEKYILFSLKEDRAKKLASVISNETARKILDYLSNKDSSETDVSKNLNLPLSTVHYNLKLLKESNLVKIKDFYWSDKGKKVYVYEISKKLIVITPHGYEVKSGLKNILSVGIIGLIVSGVIYLFSRNIYTTFEKTSPLAESVAEAPSKIAYYFIPDYALWFLFGVLFTILIYILIYLWRFRR